jgi:hypothetical protein
LAGFFDNASDAAAPGAAIGGFLGFLWAQLYYLFYDWKRAFSLATIAKVGTITAYCAAMGAAVGIVLQGFSQI